MPFRFPSMEANFQSRTVFSLTAADVNPPFTFCCTRMCSFSNSFSRLRLKTALSMREQLRLFLTGFRGEDRRWLDLPFFTQTGFPCWTVVLGSGLPWPLTHQQPTLSRHCTGAYVPSSRQRGTNLTPYGELDLC